MTNCPRKGLQSGLDCKNWKYDATPIRNQILFFGMDFKSRCNPPKRNAIRILQSSNHNPTDAWHGVMQPPWGFQKNSRVYRANATKFSYLPAHPFDVKALPVLDFVNVVRQWPDLPRSRNSLGKALVCYAIEFIRSKLSNFSAHVSGVIH